jgi:prolyl-tRNA editing enzyme YbaK/EbsC (Cys-tRNA(Pro) deacylase)
VSTDRTRAFFDAQAPDLTVLDTGEDTATVQMAAATLGVEPGQIAKTLALRDGERSFLLVTRGDARVDNAKFKATFGAKPRMLDAESTTALTGQPIGGVGPFGHSGPVTVYCDVSLQGFETVYPAAGSPTSAFAITPGRLAELAGAQWVDVSR